MLNAKMSEPSRNFLERKIPEFFDCTNLRDALLLLDNLMCDSLDDNYNPTPETREIESVYDEIYCCN